MKRDMKQTATAPHQKWMLDESEAENDRLREILSQMHTSFMNMATFNVSLRHQIRRQLYHDPPSGIVYGEQTRDASTQTSFVPPKENERTDCEVRALLERDGC